MAINKWKSIADFLPALGFFGTFFLFERDLILATGGLLIGLLLQFAIYKIRGIPIQRWMWFILGIGLLFGALTLIFQNPTFIKIRPSILGTIFGLGIVGSVLLNKNVFEMLLNKAIPYPTRTWNIIAILWSIPLLLNAFLNLIIANQIPWWNLGFSDDAWMTYRVVGGFVVVGISLALVVGYLVLTKQKPEFERLEEHNPRVDGDSAKTKGKLDS